MTGNENIIDDRLRWLGVTYISIFPMLDIKMTLWGGGGQEPWCVEILCKYRFFDFFDFDFYLIKIDISYLFTWLSGLSVIQNI